jgi:serine/threonine-protein kinase
MAPEQIRGKPPVTNKTDLYALGCVFYEMLTGNPPYDAENAAEMVQMAVGIDNGDNRPVAPMRPVEGECRGRRLRRDERVDHDHSRVALDERDVGEIRPRTWVQPPHTSPVWRPAWTGARGWG